MQIWIVYDIESSKDGDRRRRKIVKQIEKFGLIRIQKSVFTGNLAKNRINELTMFSEDLIDKNKDSVYIFPMCKTDYENVKIIGQGFDKDYASDNIGNIIL